MSAPKGPPQKAPARGLGRGLDALLGERKPAPLPAQAAPAAATPVASTQPRDQSAFRCAIEKIVPFRGQPRKHFDPVALEELAQSIREHGLLEPIVVRRLPGEERYEIVAGERRFRACQLAGIHEPLVLLRELDDQKAFELSIIENIQREDLNALEFAVALRKLIDQYGYTQESLAGRLGKNRSTISNALRLLKLPEPIQDDVLTGKLSEGHARALLGCADPKQLIVLAEKVRRGKLNVRQIEKEVRQLKKSTQANDKSAPPKSIGTADLELRLSRKFGSKCEVRDKNGKGELVIRYSDLDELDRLLEVLL